ncbi:hypothetical protein STXM2123_4572 [Streptomyces sp. F-3]|nr:hypothetical protein STXM2123_4572 [Streptomyces sp. F-3]
MTLGDGLRGEQATGHSAPWVCSGCWLIIDGRHGDRTRRRPRTVYRSRPVTAPPVSPRGSAVTCGTGILPNVR